MNWYWVCCFSCSPSFSFSFSQLFVVSFFFRTLELQFNIRRWAIIIIPCLPSSSTTTTFNTILCYSRSFGLAWHCANMFLKTSDCIQYSMFIYMLYVYMKCFPLFYLFHYGRRHPHIHMYIRRGLDFRCCGKAVAILICPCWDEKQRERQRAWREFFHFLFLLLGKHRQHNT